jgi:hypothetical protein
MNPIYDFKGQVALVTGAANNVSGPGAFTTGTSGNGSVGTRAGGGLDLVPSQSSGPGGFGRAITPSGTHGGSSH